MAENRDEVARPAGNLLRRGYHRAEAMMLAVGGQALNEFDPQWVRMTTAFAEGVGGTHQELCGALSGGTMVIGGLHGRNRLEGDDRRALELASRYRERFLTELGETRCGLLRERVHAPGGLGSCSMVVACPGRQARERAARNLLELLSE